jgi:hypothetical protein
MLPGNIRLLESAARELRDLRDTDHPVFLGDVAALSSLAQKSPPAGTRRFPVSVPSEGKTLDLLVFGFDVEGCRILFEGERIVTRTKEGWDLVRTMPRAGEAFVYTVWAFVKIGST